MNDARRKELSKAFSLIEEAKAILEHCAEEEQEAYDNLTEGLQAAERGEKMSEAAEALSEAVDSCQSIMENIESAQE